MHATVDRSAGSEGDALFFADLPDPASNRIAVQSTGPASVYGAGRKLNWPVILTIAALHVATIIALVKLDVIVVKPKAEPLVVDLIADVAPPPAEKPPKPERMPEEIVPQVVTPPQIVQTIAPPPAPIAVAPPPQRPAPVVAPPSIPVTIGNLDERMVEGEMPRYPIESRRKREQGTVLLRLLIGTDGRVVEISIAQSCGFERLDQAVLQAARKWRWQPMIRNGVPVEVRGILPFTWALKS